MIYDFEGKTPKLDPNSWVAPNAIVIGNVDLKKDSNIWFNVTLRGDVETEENNRHSRRRWDARRGDAGGGDVRARARPTRRRRPSDPRVVVVVVARARARAAATPRAPRDGDDDRHRVRRRRASATRHARGRSLASMRARGYRGDALVSSDPARARSRRLDLAPFDRSHVS